MFFNIVIITVLGFCITSASVFLFFSFSQKLNIQVNSQDSVVAIGDDIWLNGDKIKVKPTKGYSKHGHRFERRGDYLYLEYGSFNVKWDNAGTWFITITETYEALDVKGLCGDFNGEPLGMHNCFSKMYTEVHFCIEHNK